MELKIERRWKKSAYTIGNFYIDGVRLCNTLEDTDRGLVSTMPTGIINSKKVYGKTAIPTGRYRVILSVSPKFKNRPWAKKYQGLTPEVLSVKGFVGIRIHPLNTADQSYGCVGLGENTQVGKILNTTKYHDKLMSALISASEKGDEVWLTIK